MYHQRDCQCLSKHPVKSLDLFTRLSPQNKGGDKKKKKRERNSELLNRNNVFLFLPSYPDDKCKLGFSWNIVITSFSGHPGHTDLLSIHVSVLLMVSFGPFIDDFPLRFTKLE